VNKGELIDALESRLGGKKAAAEAVEHVIDVIIREVAKGSKVGITGFGTFEKVARAARIGRNPRTGASVKIKKTAVPKFKAGTRFRTVVADPRQLPKTAAAGARASATTSTSVGKATVKKTAAKKTTAKKTVARKTTAKKAAPAKKVAVKKTAVRKAAPAKKVATKKVAVKKTAVRKAAPAKKVATKKTAVKRTAPATKTAAKKTAAKRG
jgi:DNA-binding protein HU-beta